PPPPPPPPPQPTHSQYPKPQRRFRLHSLLNHRFFPRPPPNAISMNAAIFPQSSFLSPDHRRSNPHHRRSNPDPYPQSFFIPRPPPLQSRPPPLQPNQPSATIPKEARLIYKGRSR
ncbi:hypothetical protein LINPERPRIM_LOCUS615, partial [Linum perenne]